jgi:hypothetical protein
MPAGANEPAEGKLTSRRWDFGVGCGWVDRFLSGVCAKSEKVPFSSSFIGIFYFIFIFSKSGSLSDQQAPNKRRF